MIRPAKLLTIIGLTGAINLVPSLSTAMQFHRVPLPGGGIVIQGVGPIIPGDFNQLSGFVRSLPPTDSIRGFLLDSPGGNLVEAEKLANLVRMTHADVGIASGSACVSACFLIFAAGAHKIVYPHALIGVHSASESGKETQKSMGVTTAMAREAAQWGVPDAIIGKMVASDPTRVAWLTRSDLVSLGVVFVQPEQSDPAYRRTSIAAAPSPAAAASAAAQPASPAFPRGLSARGAWEQWFATLTEMSRHGAEFLVRMERALTADWGT